MQSLFAAPKYLPPMYFAAGAELGIYRRLDVNGEDTNHWLADQDLAMPMSLRAKDTNGGTVFGYYPENPQWWVTGFNPNVPDMPADDMIAIYTMDMSGKPGMFEAFYKEWFLKSEKRTKDPRLAINPFTQTVIFTFMPEGMKKACIV
jgi:hypothetical protein